MTSVLFVCLGNICRSPMAEGLFRKKLRDRGLSDRFVVDSAGTAGWHEGRPADPRTLAVLKRHGALCDMTARRVRADDFARFDWILAMDRSNLDDLVARVPKGSTAQLALALEPTGGGEVPDPYYGAGDGFERVRVMLDEALDGWLERWGEAA